MTQGAQTSGAAPTRRSGVSAALPLIALAALPVLLVREGARPITDPDAQWHVLLGKAVLSGVSLATDVDPLSTLTTVPWVFHQWLPEVAAAFADERVGWWGVGWLAHVGRLCLLLALWWVCRAEAERLAAVLALAAALLGTSMSLGPRPQLVGLCFLVVTIGAWRATSRDGRPRWWLVPLTWIWACSHGTWVLGLVIGLVQVTAIGIDRRRASALAGQGWRNGLAGASTVTLMLVPAFGALVVLLTPVGPRLLTAQQHIAQVSDLVTEWQRPTLAQVPTMLTWAVAGLVAVAMTFGWKRQSWSAVDLATWAMACVCLMAYQRTVAVAAILLAPLLAARLGGWLRRPRPPASRADRWVPAFAAVASAAILAALLPQVASQPGGVPAGLTSALSELPPGTVVVNDERLGGWLLATQPKLTPTVDTRFEAYGRTSMQDHLRLVTASTGWGDRLAATGATAVLLPTQTPLVTVLVGDPGWSSLGQDAGFTLLQRR